MKKAIAITPENIGAICHHIMLNPGKYAARSVEHARRIKTKGRYHQACLAAGRNAIAEALFEHFPALEGRFRRLTAAIREGYGEKADFDLINKQGAKALRLL